MSLQCEPAKLSLGRGGIRNPVLQCVAMANQRLRPLLFNRKKYREKQFCVFTDKQIVFCKYKKTTECDTCNTLKKSWDKGKTKLKRLQVTLFWKVPQLAA